MQIGRDGRSIRRRAGGRGRKGHTGKDGGKIPEREGQ